MYSTQMYEKMLISFAKSNGIQAYVDSGDGVVVFKKKVKNRQELSSFTKKVALFAKTMRARAQRHSEPWIVPVFLSGGVNPTVRLGVAMTEIAVVDKRYNGA